MAKLDVESYRADFNTALEGEKSFYIERPAVFSPAAAAQDRYNQSRMLWSWNPLWMPWEYSGWLEEARAVHETACIADWSGLVRVRVKGRQALEYFSWLGTNDLADLQIGHSVHHVQTNVDGKIASHGLLCRTDEEKLLYTGSSAYWSVLMHDQSKWDTGVQVFTPDRFLFTVQGPLARRILEEAFDAGLGHLDVNRFDRMTICDVRVDVIRTQGASEYCFELHGPADVGNDVWTKVVEAGARHGLKPQGVRAQLISPVEMGMATDEYDVIPAAVDAPGAPYRGAETQPRVTGSYTLARHSDLFRTPAEVGWQKYVSLDSHDFLGREALQVEHDAGGPERTLCGLVWNEQDVVNIHATLFSGGQTAVPMELPRYVGLAVDSVKVDGAEVGMSTSRVYSPKLNRMISLGFLPKALAKAGSQVTVMHGEKGGPQVPVRATVTNLPFANGVSAAG